MSKAATSVLLFGIYLAFLGVTLVAIPNVFLGVFGMPAASDIWIRVVGVLVLCLAFYYTQAGRRGLDDFFQWTVYVRCFVFVSFVVFVVLKLVQPILALFGVIDLAGATWTLLALRQRRRA
jgi:hypothetical protein